MSYGICHSMGDSSPHSGNAKSLICWRLYFLSLCHLSPFPLSLMPCMPCKIGRIWWTVLLWQCLWWTWWRHQIETFSVLLAICVGNSPVTGEVPAKRPVTRSLSVFFDLRLNKRLSKQWWGWWFETLSRPLIRHCNYNIRHRRPCMTSLSR